MARIEFYAQAALLKQQLTTGGNRTKIQRRTNREATQSDHVNHTQSRAVLRIIQAVSCKATIYPGVTNFGNRFDVYNDATVVDVIRDEEQPGFAALFAQVVRIR